MMPLLLEEFVGLAIEMNPVVPPCVRTEIQSGCIVLCTARTLCKVHQRAKSVAFRLVDVMPLLLGEFSGLAVVRALSFCSDMDRR